MMERGVESVFEVQYTDAEGAGFGCLQCSEGNVAVGFMEFVTIQVHYTTLI